MMKKSMHETVLYYNPESSSKVMKLKGVLVRMGVRIRNVSSEQVLEKVGTLAGLPAYERAVRDSGNDSEFIREHGSESGEAETMQIPVIPEEILVMHGFSSRRIDELLAGLRKAGVPKVELKAIVTETNADWTFYHLYEEIKEEHERMKQMEKERNQGKA